jgi:hypothetical protein
MLTLGPPGRSTGPEESRRWCNRWWLRRVPAKETAMAAAISGAVARFLRRGHSGRRGGAPGLVGEPGEAQSGEARRRPSSGAGGILGREKESQREGKRNGRKRRSSWRSREAPGDRLGH